MGVRADGMRPMVSSLRVEFIPLSFWYDAPLISRDSDRRHDHGWFTVHRATVPPNGVPGFHEPGVFCPKRRICCALQAASEKFESERLCADKRVTTSCDG